MSDQDSIEQAKRAVLGGGETEKEYPPVRIEGYSYYELETDQPLSYEAKRDIRILLRNWGINHTAVKDIKEDE